jgi:hypothetical protein
MIAAAYWLTTNRPDDVLLWQLAWWGTLIIAGAISLVAFILLAWRWRDLTPRQRVDLFFLGLFL